MEQKIIAQDGAEMILIPEGNFTMGVTVKEREDRQRLYASNEVTGVPLKKVFLDSYYIDKIPVTNEQYKKFVEITGHPKPKGQVTLYAEAGGAGAIRTKVINNFQPWNHPEFNKPLQPVVCVDWEDAKAYADWAGKRLPTEAQWEKAARGPNSRTYPWGEKFEADEDLCNWWIAFPGMTYGLQYGYKYTTNVNMFTKGASPYGVLDMAGNVWEWTNDWYTGLLGSEKTAKNPTGPNIGRNKVVRGGSWVDMPRFMITTVRSSSKPNTKNALTGFRCVL